MANTLYKIYYDIGVVYIGRTRQPLNNRLRGHFFKIPMFRGVDIFAVTKVEYAELETVADMFVMEVIEINRHKPDLNCDDKARDNLTLDLPEIEYKPYECRLMDKWKEAIEKRDGDEAEKRKAEIARQVEQRELRRQRLIERIEINMREEASGDERL